jgi:glycosyltransferase involved in cell wall biosynthesis
MQDLPRISIITPSYNQAQFITETIESVVAQNYPNLEHIVVDGGSSDGTLEILSRYPHLKVISEPDQGQADAINKGFRLATGSIWGFLNSDDTYMPGALSRVAQEVNPVIGRHIVMGRCAFIDALSEEIGVEHPSAFENHTRVLKIWLGYAIPQPAVFWTPEVWKTCGEMDTRLHFALDYDLFCRFSQKYRFHTIDQVLATYRLHEDAKTSQQSNAERLKDAIIISQRYWGKSYLPKYWLLALSLAWNRFNRIAKAQRLLGHAREAWRTKHGLSAFRYGVVGGLLAPEFAFYTGVYPRLSRSGKQAFANVINRVRSRQPHPETLARMNNLHLYPDGWAGPNLHLTQETQAITQTFILEGKLVDPKPRNARRIHIRLDNQEIASSLIESENTFRLTIPLESPLQPGQHNIEISANWWFVPHTLSGAPDYRPLSWKVKEITMR